MKILGLDLSLVATGWCVWNDAALSYETITPQKPILRQWVELERMHFLRTQICDLAMGADLVVIEDFSFGSKGAALFQIAGLGYLVRHALWRRDLSMVLVPPAQVKKFVSGKGTAPKEIVLREVFKRWGHNADDNNAADAIVLNYIGQALAGVFEPTAEFQLEVLKDVRRRCPDLDVMVCDL